MPANNSTARPKNRGQKAAAKKLRDINALETKLRKQLKNGDITKAAFNRAMKKLEPAAIASTVKGTNEARSQAIRRSVDKKNMTTSGSRRTGSKIKN